MIKVYVTDCLESYENELNRKDIEIIYQNIQPIQSSIDWQRGIMLSVTYKVKDVEQ